MNTWTALINHSNLMKKEQKIKIAFILTLLTVLLFLALDLVLAALLIDDTDRTFRTSHAYHHHGLLPNQKANARWSHIIYSFRTNSLGFRDKEIRKIPLTTDKKRILLMGDSHTEGVGVSYAETFAGRLAEKLEKENYEVLNAAAVSYSPRIYYLKTKYLLEEKGLRFDELFVFIDISDIQNEIVYENYQPERETFSKKMVSILRNQAINKSFTLHTLQKIKKQRQTERFLKKATVFDSYRQKGDQADALELYASFFSEFDDNILLSNPQFHGVSGWLYEPAFAELAKKGLNLGRENMIRLHDLCKEYNIRLTISVHPWQEQIARRDTEDSYVRFWKKFSEDYNTGFINFYPSFINPPVSAAMGIEYFIAGDNHWNSNGHWLVAEELYNYISKRTTP